MKHDLAAFNWTDLILRIPTDDALGQYSSIERMGTYQTNCADRVTGTEGTLWTFPK